LPVARLAALARCVSRFHLWGRALALLSIVHHAFVVLRGDRLQKHNLPKQATLPAKEGDAHQQFSDCKIRAIE
jgi:hypothetical protein